jgi:hypothetical protein
MPEPPGGSSGYRPSNTGPDREYDGNNRRELLPNTGAAFREDSCAHHRNTVVSGGKMLIKTVKCPECCETVDAKQLITLVKKDGTVITEEQEDVWYCTPCDLPFRFETTKPICASDNNLGFV